MRKLKSMLTSVVSASSFGKFALTSRQLIFLAFSVSFVAGQPALADGVPVSGTKTAATIASAQPSAQVSDAMTFQSASAQLGQNGAERVSEVQKHLCAIQPPASSLDKFVSTIAPPVDCHLGTDKAAESLGCVGAALKAEKVSAEAAAKDAKYSRELTFLKLYSTSGDSDMGGGMHNVQTVEQLQSYLDFYKAELEKYKTAMVTSTTQLQKIAGAKQSLQTISNGQTGSLSSESKQTLVETLNEQMVIVEKLTSHNSGQIESYTQQALLLQKNNNKQDAFLYFEEVKKLKAKQENRLATKSQLAAVIQALNGETESPSKELPVDRAISALTEREQNLQYGAGDSGMVEQYNQKIKSIEAMIAAKKEADAKAVAAAPAADPRSPPVEARLRELEAKFKNNGQLSMIAGNQGHQNCGLSVAEELSIIWYCGSGYGSLNGALRSTDPAVIEKFKPFKDTLNEALKKLSPYGGYTVRGSNLPKSIRDQHTVGNIVKYSAFTSTSLTRGFGSSDMFVIKSKTGHYVGSYSGAYHENEVLFASDTKFKILSVDKVDGANQYIMEEVVD